MTRLGGTAPRANGLDLSGDARSEPIGVRYLAYAVADALDAETGADALMALSKLNSLAAQAHDHANFARDALTFMHEQQAEHGPVAGATRGAGRVVRVITARLTLTGGTDAATRDVEEC